MRFRTFGSGARAACFSGASSDCADEFGFLPSLCRKRNLCSVATTACSHDMRERARNESLVAGKVACQRADSSEQFLLCPVVSSAGQPVADSMRIVADADESAEHRGGFGRPCFADGRFPLVVRACEKWVVPFNPRCASSGEGSSICRIKSRNSSRRETAMLSEMCFLLTWAFTLFRRVAYR